MSDLTFRFKALIAACRPRQWPKKLLVFASAIFRFRADPLIWINSRMALISFCLNSSAVSLVNDVIDVQTNGSHPSTCRRPIASGALPVPFALTGALVLFGCSLAVAVNVNQALAGVNLARVFQSLFNMANQVDNQEPNDQREFAGLHDRAGLVAGRMATGTTRIALEPPAMAKPPHGQARWVHG